MWRTKIAAKIMLSRLPLQYKFWRKLNLFRHGFMDEPSYAYGTFITHFDRARFQRKRDKFVALELGPGDSLFSALICRAFGASRTYLIDTDRFARNDVVPYRQMLAYLREKNLELPNLSGAACLEDFLNTCGATYSARGLDSLREIPDASIDFIWSQAVLEHVKLSDFRETMLQLRRILRSDGVCSHQVDLADHLGGALNNLRFSRRLWESRFMSSSGFYTNRIRYRQMIGIFEECGFSAHVVKVERWNRVPTPRSWMSKEFRYLDDDELCVKGFDALLIPT
jgi:SAM-dependent methyltransferase